MAHKYGKSKMGGKMSGKYSGKGMAYGRPRTKKKLGNAKKKMKGY